MDQDLALEIHNLKKDLWDFYDTLKIQRELLDFQKERIDELERKVQKSNFFQKFFCMLRVKGNADYKPYEHKESIRQGETTNVHETEIRANPQADV